MADARIAIQGERGSYSAAAAHLRSADAALLPCRQFRDVFEALSRGEASTAVVPLENSLAGSVHQNYDLIREYNCWITGEVLLPVEHCLIGMPGAVLEDIKQVVSHPVALEQCRDFLERHGDWRVSRSYDTSGSVKQIMEEGRTETAAIASETAAEVHGGTVIASAIQDNRFNFTRFVELKMKREIAESAGKTSIVFSFKNLPGALYKALSVFALRDIDLTKIESRPQPEATWRYIFYIDFLGRLDDERVHNALNHLAEVTELLEVLGCYPADESVRRQFL